MAWKFRNSDAEREKASWLMPAAMGFGLLASVVWTWWKLGFNPTPGGLVALIVLVIAFRLRQLPTSTTADNPNFNVGLEKAKLHLRWIFGGFSLALVMLVVALGFSDGGWDFGMVPIICWPLMLSVLLLKGTFKRYRQIKKFDAKLS